MLEEVTPLILTYNEAPNLDRTLQKLNWAKEIIVIDSYSEDATLEILQRYPHVQVFQRGFDSFAAQCNFGLSKITSEWVLSLDADYVLSDALIDEMKTLVADSTINGYRVPFRYCVFGHRLRGTLLPARTVLYRRNQAVYQNDGHAHRVQVRGQCVTLSAPIDHDDRKSLTRWLWAQDRYMMLETEKLINTPNDQLSFGDRLRKHTLIAPFVVLLYCLIVKGGIFDGWPGWYYAFQRVLAEILLTIRLIEAKKITPSVIPH